MSTYAKLDATKDGILSQLGKIGAIRKYLETDGKRSLFAYGNSIAIVPEQFAAEFDALLDRIQAHHQQEIEKINKQLDAVEILLAGYAAKEQQK